MFAKMIAEVNNLKLNGDLINEDQKSIETEVRKACQKIDAKRHLDLRKIMEEVSLFATVLGIVVFV